MFNFNGKDFNKFCLNFQSHLDTHSIPSRNWNTFQSIILSGLHNFEHWTIVSMIISIWHVEPKFFVIFTYFHLNTYLYLIRQSLNLNRLEHDGELRIFT